MSELATIDTSGFNRFLGDLVTIGGPGTNAAAVVQAEVGQVLQTAIRYTPQATQKKIRQRADYRFNQKYAIRGSGDLKVTMNTGERKGQAFGEHVWLRSGGKFYIMRGPGRWPAGSGGSKSRFSPNGAHWPDRIWQQYQSLIDQSPEELQRIKKEWTLRALAAQGLARQSWVQVADALGISLSSERAAELRAVKASDGRVHLNGTGSKQQTADKLVFTLSNSLPALVSGGLDGLGIISRAMSARESAFGIALDKGLLRDVDFICKRYPALLAA